ncbi:MAG: hypothetical protein PHP79_01655 [Clostridia bacterium]|jgi:hypothetical protein|nr:hypothetical protein [Clostridia bacterium]MDD4679587.1 hypothetical protein [Clostridia bacterium]
MKPEEIKVELIAPDTDTDILRFHVGDKPLDVNLNSAECQNSLKDVFAALLKLLIYSDINLELLVGDEYKRVMYVEVCTEYINDLNRELADVKDELRNELL